MASHPSSVLTSTANRSVASLRCSGGGWIVQGQRRLQAPRSAILGSRTSRSTRMAPVAAAASSGNDGKEKRPKGLLSMLTAGINALVGTDRGPERLNDRRGRGRMGDRNSAEGIEDNWMDWQVEPEKHGGSDWEDHPMPSNDLDGISRRNPNQPQPLRRPNYPEWTSSRKGQRYRDEWLKPMVDREGFRQRLLMSEEEAESVQEQEVRANQFESQQALKFAALLVFTPLVTSSLLTASFIHPVLDKALQNKEAFPLSGMQEIEGAHEVHLEEMRMRMDVTLGRAPPLTDDEMQAHLRHYALEICDEKREENRNGLMHFAQDMLTAVIFMTLLLTESEGRGYLFRTMERVYQGVSDLGKAFFIILTADTLMGYHSEEGWTAGIRVLAAHWNFEPEENSVHIFVAVVPVLLDSLFKLWLFSSFTRMNPAATVTLKSMDRH